MNVNVLEKSLEAARAAHTAMVLLTGALLALTLYVLVDRPYRDALSDLLAVQAIGISDWDDERVESFRASVNREAEMVCAPLIETAVRIVGSKYSPEFLMPRCADRFFFQPLERRLIDEATIQELRLLFSAPKFSLEQYYHDRFRALASVQFKYRPVEPVLATQVDQLRHLPSNSIIDLRLRTSEAPAYNVEIEVVFQAGDKNRAISLTASGVYSVDRKEPFRWLNTRVHQASEDSFSGADAILDPASGEFLPRSRPILGEIRSLTIAEAIKYLRDHGGKGQPVVFAGIEIRDDFLVVVGPSLVLLVLLFFLMQLGNLTRLLPGERVLLGFPWIAVMHGRLPLVATLGSVLLGPIATSALLLVLSLGHNSCFLTLLAATLGLATLVAALVAWFRVRRIRNYFNESFDGA